MSKFEMLQGWQTLIVGILSLGVGGIGWAIGLLWKINSKFTTTFKEVADLRTEMTHVQEKVEDHNDYIQFHRGLDAAREPKLHGVPAAR